MQTCEEEKINLSTSLPHAHSAWLVCLTASLFFFYEFVQMMMFNALNPSLMQAFNITATDVGKISSAYFYANILFMFPAGILLDRFSTRKIILSAMLCCIAGTLFFSLATNIHLAMICRFLTGIGGSFPFLCCLRLSSRWFPPRKWALVSGMMVTVAFIGGIAGQTPMTFLIEIVGWRHALQVDALLGIFFTYLIYLQVQDYPNNCAIEISTPKKLAVWVAIKNAILNKQNWFYGIYTSMLNLPVMLLGAIWGGLYLVQVFALTKTQASYVTSMILAGTIVGSPILGWLSDCVGLRKIPMIICAILSLILILILMYSTSLTITELAILFFFLGFITSAQIISYPAISESNPHEMSASALGLASVLIMSAPAIFQPVFGWLMDLTWDGKKIDGVPFYSIASFHHALMIMPIAFIVGIMVILFAQETHCRLLHGNDYKKINLK